MTELKPCPFCCGEAAPTGDDCLGWLVSCDSCEASTQVFDTKAEAIAAWNTRAERTCCEMEIDKFFRGCSECGYMWEYMYGIGRRVGPNYCPNCGARVIETEAGRWNK